MQLYHEVIDAGDVEPKKMLGFSDENGIALDQEVKKAVQLYYEQ